MCSGVGSDHTPAGGMGAVPLALWLLTYNTSYSRKIVLMGQM